MAFKNQSADGRPVPEASSTTPTSHIYRSHQEKKQIRFSGRRKIVKRYGHYAAASSPKQQSLTQAGYTISLPPALRQTYDDLESGEDDLSDAHFRSTASLHASVPLAREGSNKRLKLKHKASGPTATDSLHTQTLTQFVSKCASTKAAGVDDEGQLDAIIWDSENEGLSSPPSGLFKPPATPKRNETRALRPSKGHPASFSPDDRFFLTLTEPTSASRTEIPSSQPSPFTPVMLFDRSQDSVDQQCSSPSLDIAARRSAQMSDEDGGAVTEREAKQLFCNRAREQSGAANASHGAAGKCSHAASMADEIPDSDEDDIEFSGPCALCQRDALTVSQPIPSESISSSPAVDAISLTISATTSSPLSPLLDVWSTSPTPLPELLQADSTDAKGETPTAKSAESIESNLLKSLDLDNHTYHNSVTGDASLLPTCGIDALPCSQTSSQEQRARASVSCQEGSNPASRSQDTRTIQSQYSQGLESQGLESQRVPLEVIRMLGPQTDRSDIIISLHPEQIRRIVSGKKDHDFRSYKIPHTVSRFWIYATRPVCELQYMAVVAAGYRQPGEIDSESGFGNADFNAGRLVAKFAYKLMQVYQLNNPVSLDVMKSNGWKGPPRRYDYLPPAVVGSLLGNLRCALFEEASESDYYQADLDLMDLGELPSKETPLARGSMEDETITDAGSRNSTGKNDSSCANEELSVSQEIEAQLLRDVSDTQTSQNLRSAAIPSSQGQIATPATSPTILHESWPSQKTIDAVSVTQEVPSRDRSPVEKTVFKAGLEERIAILNKNDAHENRGRYDLDSVSRCQKSLPMPQRRSGDELRLPLPQTAMGSSIASTQSALPESLYEEVRQAPPVFILDSEDSDGSAD